VQIPSQVIPGAISATPVDITTIPSHGKTAMQHSKYARLAIVFGRVSIGRAARRAALRRRRESVRTRLEHDYEMCAACGF